LPELTLVQNLW